MTGPVPCGPLTCQWLHMQRKLPSERLSALHDLILTLQARLRELQCMAWHGLALIALLF